MILFGGDTTTIGQWGIEYDPNTKGLNFWRPFGVSSNWGNYFLFLQDATGYIGIGTAAPNEQLEITKNFSLPHSTATTGIIKSGGATFIHNFGIDNFFAGVNAGNLLPSLIGTGNTGVGVNALQFNQAGSGDTAVGLNALHDNQVGNSNTAVGLNALRINNSDNNTAVGFHALETNTMGSANTAMGLSALEMNISGAKNTAVGFHALNLSTFDDNTAVGDEALSGLITGDGNIALGTGAGATLVNGQDNIYIGNGGVTTNESNTIRIGTAGTHTKTFIAGISGVPVSSTSQVCVDTAGQLGICGSSSRFKDHIEDMGSASEILYHLRPVSFLYKPEYGGSPDQPQVGLIAEEVAKVAPWLVAYDEQGKPYTVYYQFLAPMLLNELQKKDAELKELRLRLEVLERRVDELSKK
jgi:hypothetical protein